MTSQQYDVYVFRADRRCPLAPQGFLPPLSLYPSLPLSLSPPLPLSICLCIYIYIYIWGGCQTLVGGQSSGGTLFPVRGPFGQGSVGRPDHGPALKAIPIDRLALDPAGFLDPAALTAPDLGWYWSKASQKLVFAAHAITPPYRKFMFL